MTGELMGWRCTRPRALTIVSRFSKQQQQEFLKAAGRQHRQQQRVGVEGILGMRTGGGVSASRVQQHRLLPELAGSSMGTGHLWRTGWLGVIWQQLPAQQLPARQLPAQQLPGQRLRRQKLQGHQLNGRQLLQRVKLLLHPQLPWQGVPGQQHVGCMMPGITRQELPGMMGCLERATGVAPSVGECQHGEAHSRLWNRMKTRSSLLGQRWSAIHHAGMLEWRQGPRQLRHALAARSSRLVAESQPSALPPKPPPLLPPSQQLLPQLLSAARRQPSASVAGALAQEGRLAAVSRSLQPSLAVVSRSLQQPQGVMGYSLQPPRTLVSCCPQQQPGAMRRSPQQPLALVSRCAQQRCCLQQPLALLHQRCLQQPLVVATRSLQPLQLKHDLLQLVRWQLVTDGCSRVLPVSSKQDSGRMRASVVPVVQLQRQTWRKASPQGGWQLRTALPQQPVLAEAFRSPSSPSSRSSSNRSRARGSSHTGSSQMNSSRTGSSRRGSGMRGSRRGSALGNTASPCGGKRGSC